MKPLRVVMVGPYPAEGGRVVGGVAAVTTYLSRALANRDDVELHGVSFKRGQSGYTCSESFGYPLHRLPSAPFGPITLFRPEQRGLDELVARLAPDIIHGQGVDLPGLVAVRSRGPSVVTVHGLVMEDAKYLTGLKKRWRARFVGYRVQGETLRRARDVILISPYVADYYGARLTASQHNVQNPVSEEFFNVSRHAEHGRFLFAGHVNPRKGVLDLVRAFASISKDAHAKLVVAGSLDVNPGYTEKVQALCRGLGVERSVHFRGLLSDEAMLEELAKAHAFVLPSYQETAPMVIQEAMAAGVPVIASRICGIPYQVDDGVTGWLFERGDLPALTDRMRRVLSDSPWVDRASAAARAKAQAYRADAVASRTVQVYEAILARGRADQSSVV